VAEYTQLQQYWQVKPYLAELLGTELQKQRFLSCSCVSKMIHCTIMHEKHTGDTLDGFLEKEGLLAETEAVAIKRVIAFQISQLMEQQDLSKAEMARRMQTSRAAVDRLLDPSNDSATLTTLEKADLALGKRLQVALV
jgi:predicted XRE-type DNA-binding protein